MFRPRVIRSQKPGRRLSVPIKDATKRIDRKSRNEPGPPRGIAIVTAQVRTVTISLGLSIPEGRNHGNDANEPVTTHGLFLPRCQHEVRENRWRTLRIDFTEKKKETLVVLARSCIGDDERG